MSQKHAVERGNIMYRLFRSLLESLKMRVSRYKPVATWLHVGSMRRGR